jgi:ribosomal protein L37AE/L43A
LQGRGFGHAEMNPGILSAMHTDPVTEWRRLADHYRSLGEEELRLLAQHFPDLTDSAQQALRSELQSRGLGDPETIAQAAANPAPRRTSASAREFPSESADAPADAPTDAPADEPVDVLAHQAGPDESRSDGPLDYTWKVLLCDCEEGVQAWQLSQALTRAGIDNWPQYAGRTGQRYSRVFVAADQLEQARMIASQPIPQDIVAESEEQPGEFVPPTCPGCGATDPVLESADPVNAWRCEVCGRDWTEGTENAVSAAESTDSGRTSAPEGRVESFFGK